MATPKLEPEHRKTRHAGSQEESTNAESQRVVTFTIIEIVALAVGVGAAINLFFYALPRGNRAQMIYGFAAAIIFCTIGIAAHLLAQLPQSSTPSNPHVATERAYLDAVDFVVKNFAPNVVPIMAFQIKNSGQTPASLVSITVTRHIEKELPTTPHYGPVSHKYDGVQISPGSRFGFIVDEQDQQLSPHMFDQLKTGNMRMWIFGRIVYRDIFPDTPQHELGFCAVFTPKFNSFAMENAPGYNYAN